MKFKISDIEIDNFYSFKNSHFRNIKDYNVLIGKNNSGKSNLLKILEIIKDDYTNSKNYDSSILFDSLENLKAKIVITFKLSKEYRIQFFEELFNANYFAGMFPKIYKKPEEEVRDNLQKKFINQGILSSVKVSFCLNEPLKNLTLNEISILCKGLQTEKPIFITELTKHGPQYFTIKIEQFINALNFDEFFDFSINRDLGKVYDAKNLYDLRNIRRSLIIENNVLINKIFTDILIELPNFLEFISPIRQFKDVDKISDAERDDLFLNGSNIGKFIFFKENNDKNWMVEFNNDFKEFFPILEKLTQNIRDIDTIHHYKEKGLDMPIRYKNKGSGIMQIAFILMILKKLGKGKILFLEEPELYIFPGLQKKLKKKFLSISNDIQIFITTHSSYFISNNIKKSSVFLIKKEENISKIENISKKSIQKVFTELEISPFDYLLYDGYILVEGKDDKIFIKKIIMNFSNSNIKVIIMKGKRNYQYYVNQEILDSLKIASINFVYFLDKDRNNKEFFNQIGDDRLKKIVKENTIFTPYYELENFLLNPLFLYDFLKSKNKNNVNYPDDFNWINNFVPNLFEQKGEDLRYEYIIKRINEKFQLGMKSKDIKDSLILPKTEKYNNKEETFEFWANNYLPNYLWMQKNKGFVFVEKYNNKSIITELELINTHYDWDLEEKKYNKMISGKKVLKKINTELNSRYSVQISKPILIEHLVNFIKDYMKYEKKQMNNISFNSSLILEEIQEFRNYLNTIVDIVLDIHKKLKIDLTFSLNDLNFLNLEKFLQQRWSL